MCQTRYKLVRLCFAIVILSTLVLSFAHKPRFPEGDGPFEVVEPSISQAFYLYLGEGEKHSFVVPPLGRLEPLELLVLDNELGQSLNFEMEWRCGDVIKTDLRYLDEPFREPFSGMNHRYRVVDAVGPTEEDCIATIWESSGKPGPYTFAIGKEERFGFADLAIFVTLGTELRTWMDGGK